MRDLLEQLREVNAAAPFNRWAAFEVAQAQSGLAELELRWRDEFAQYSGFLHAGLVAALIDTACGFAAFSLAGPSLASNLAVNFLAPARGLRFRARGEVVKAGRRQVFTQAELLADAGGGFSRVATGQTLLVPVAAETPRSEESAP